MTSASIRTLSAYSPPANLSDLTDENKQRWSEQNIAHWIQSEIDAIDPDTGEPLTGPDNIPRTPLSQFFNGTVTAFDVDQAASPIHWKAFPNLVCATHGKRDGFPAKGHRLTRSIHRRRHFAGKLQTQVGCFKTNILSGLSTEIIAEILSLQHLLAKAQKYIIPTSKLAETDYQVLAISCRVSTRYSLGALQEYESRLRKRNERDRSVSDQSGHQSCSVRSSKQMELYHQVRDHCSPYSPKQFAFRRS